jgi:hypothetical protein
MINRSSILLALPCLALFVAACGRDSRAAAHATDEPPAAAGFDAACTHAACGHDYFVDATPSPACAAGANCAVALTLVATGDYHINDEYPYKFKADEARGVTFLGTDGAGKNVFSKSAHDWTKTDEKTGKMIVAFNPTDKGSTTITGTFKLSVCSRQNCQLEQQPLAAVVAVR